MNDMNGCCGNYNDFSSLVNLVRDVLIMRLACNDDFGWLEYRRYGETRAELIAWHNNTPTGYGVTISPFFTMPEIMKQIDKCVNDFI